MKFVPKVLCGVAFLASALLAGGVALAAGWSNQVIIASIEADSDSTKEGGTATYLYFTTTPTGKPACATSTAYQITGTADHVKAVTSLATTAMLTGRGVKVYWSGACEGTYGKIPHLMLF